MYSQILYKCDVSQKLIQRTSEQWSTFMKDKGNWLANVTMRDGLPNDYKRLNALGLKFMVQSIINEQCQRSQAIWQVKRIECQLNYNKKEKKRQKLKRFLLRTSMEADNMEDFKKMCVSYLKENNFLN